MVAEQTSNLDRVYNLAENSDWQHLLDYLGFLEGFGLILVLAPEQAGVDVCRRGLRQHYAQRDRSLHCLSLNMDQALGALGDHLLHDNLPSDTAAVWVDAPAADSAKNENHVRELWRLALAALNPRRNSIRRRLTVPLILAGPVWLQEVAREAAADLWSIRDTIARIEPARHDLTNTAFEGMNFDLLGGEVDGDPGDPEETRLSLHRLRDKQVPSSHQAERCALEARLLQRLGNQLRRLHNWQEAEAALLEAENLMERNPRSLDDQLWLLFDLYSLYSSAGNLYRAEYYARKAQEFTTSHFGSADSKTLACRNNLAIALRAQGKNAESEQEHRAVLAIREQFSGAEHPQTLKSQNNLANALAAQGKNAEAERAHRLVLSIRQRVLGGEHPDTLMSLNNLASTINAQGRYVEAEQEQRALVATKERVLGIEHPDTLMSRNNLANALSAQGKLAEAEQEYRAVLAIRERVLGVEHPHTLKSRNNLAAALQDEGKYVEAEQEHRAVLALRERVLGAEHPDVYLTCYNLALALEKQRKLPEALSLMQRAEAGLVKVWGEGHPNSQNAQTARDRIEASLKLDG